VINGHKHVPLNDGRYAILSCGAEPARAVVFVHGWGGSPVSTWYRFQEVVDHLQSADALAWWSVADLFFYRYESRRFSIAEHAEAFLRFLDQVFPVPSLLASVGESQLMLRKYNELYLVGHSLGGVVIRESILDRAAKATVTVREIEGSTALLDARLRLFAPAMHGVKPSGWFGLAYHLLREIREVEPWFKAAMESQTIVRQLMSDSDKIARLRARTEELARTTRHPALIATVVYGEDEHIVERDKYELDDIEVPVPGRDHRSICKPDDQYRNPLNFVMTGKNE
jgi:pimeloyl-ACP methyl ester carboxylesterase